MMLHRAAQAARLSAPRAMLPLTPRIPRCALEQLRHHGSHGHSHGRAAAEADSESYKVLSAGLLTDLGLAVLKAGAGVFSGSAALISDAVHSTSDMLISLSAIVSSRMAAQRPDKDHPYGHGRFDSIGGLAVSGILTAAGLSIGYHAGRESLQILQHGIAAAGRVPPSVVADAGAHAAATPLPAPGSGDGGLWSALVDLVTHPPDLAATLYNAQTAELMSSNPTGVSVALAACIASVAVKEWIYRWSMKVGMEKRSNVMIANAYHHRADSLSSLVAIAGIAGSYMGIAVLDPAAAVAVAAMITHAGVTTGISAVRELVDERMDDDAIAAAVDAARNYDDIRAIRSVRARRMGPSVLLDMECAVDSNITIRAATDISERIRQDIFRERKEVSEVLIHFATADEHDAWDRLRPRNVLPEGRRNEVHDGGHGHSHDEGHGHSHGDARSEHVKAEEAVHSVTEIVDQVRAKLLSVKHVRAVTKLEVHAESSASHLLHVHAEIALDMHLPLREALAVVRKARTVVKDFTAPVQTAPATAVWSVSEADVDLDVNPV